MSSAGETKEQTAKLALEQAGPPMGRLALAVAKGRFAGEGSMDFDGVGAVAMAGTSRPSGPGQNDARDEKGKQRGDE
jgi:hypothetical protein